MRQLVQFGVMRPHMLDHLSRGIIELLADGPDHGLDARAHGRHGQRYALMPGQPRHRSGEIAGAVLKQIQDLQRMPGKKTIEVEILREAMEYGRSKHG